ncbi:putative selenate reductase subunit YgfK [Vallitalea pronyensis]|uniref:dihydrouracil dehydrogenase (NAD(+)) n=1 Tax=Vallitalea pronyensis TaxID=1348613 RepID=A0A8J8ML96_9FIRM|nr:putative selenate reductase subunit YgfK [Vallitalea pronyensis]QUI23482.1 putative selenate reductase subunit YgfK [Vallitalea pronyensis]
MNDRMIPIPFHELMGWILQEKEEHQQIFGVKKYYHHTHGEKLDIFGEHLETPFGPAAGPHTQLAQNIIAAYVAGCRFFELKTVQTLDGEDLPVSKPCIKAEDEGYNVEWSTELTVPEAFDEYVKAWYGLKLLSKEYGFGSPEGFIFNMSVGYDYEGITSKKIDTFIEGLKDASHSKIWATCEKYILDNLDAWHHVDESYVHSISSSICTSITLSTLHGCPPEEIERIASYLMKEKHLNTYIKCNPTLLGYDYARSTLDEMGYDYLVFDEHHFQNDLQFEDAIPMIKRLQGIAKNNHVSFGVKLTNTFPVKITQNELPGEEMYMSGRSLYPLSISLADKLTKALGGDINISYSGGAEIFNITDIYNTGIWPITIATTLLKSGGYGRCLQIAEKLGNSLKTDNPVNPDALDQLRTYALTDPHHIKPIKPMPSRKIKDTVPLVNCFMAPCSHGCPIEQAVPAYLHCVEEGRYLDALQIIVDKNPLPFITGTVCNHRCMTKCTRHFYEEPVKIRSAKLLAAEQAMDALLGTITVPEKKSDAKVAVIGGGPAGLAAGYFLGRAGMDVTIFEKQDSLGGIVKHVVPEFRISSESVQHDIDLVKAMGVTIKLNSEQNSIKTLQEAGYPYILIAVGAYEPGILPLEGTTPQNVLEFLADYRKQKGNMHLGESVAVIGGGNTAMDAARAAKRVQGVKDVYLIYRRTKKYMPADEEELYLALEDGITFMELLSPTKWVDGKLTCQKMILGAPDASGRRRPVPTDDMITVEADTVVAAVGEKIDSSWFAQQGITLTDKGYVEADLHSCETSMDHVYVAGDALRGPATIVEAIADATSFALSVLEKEAITETGFEDLSYKGDAERAYAKKGILEMPVSNSDGNRCLECSTICEACVDVCPNRANITVKIPSQHMPQIIHLDNMCNECGNCETFCPYSSAPYQDKFTLFGSEAMLQSSHNAGFFIKDKTVGQCVLRLDGQLMTINLHETYPDIPVEIMEMMQAVCEQYTYYNY